VQDRTATSYVDYQARATGFHVGDRVAPTIGGNFAQGGTVVAVFPAIGMVDVQFPHGASRMPVEDLQVDPNDTDPYVDSLVDSVPGNRTSVSVPGGPYPIPLRESVQKVASRHVRALYWGAPDRRYRATRDESEAEGFFCPRCQEKPILRKTVYTRQNGKSERLLCCPTCLFLIRPSELILG